MFSGDAKRVRSTMYGTVYGEDVVDSYSGAGTGTSSFLGVVENTTNTAAGDYSGVVGGLNNDIVSGSYSFIGGGQSNFCSSTYGTLTGGDNNGVITGTYNTVSGGRYNIASGDYSTVGGGGGASGLGNEATATHTTVAGGENNIASGAYSTVGGGENNAASGDYSAAMGKDALAAHHGSFALASGSFASQGDAQTVTYHLRNVSVTSNDVTLFLNGTSGEITLPSDYACIGTYYIISIGSGVRGTHIWQGTFALEEGQAQSPMEFMDQSDQKYGIDPAQMTAPTWDGTTLRFQLRGTGGFNCRHLARVTLTMCEAPA